MNKIKTNIIIIAFFIGFLIFNCNLTDNSRRKHDKINKTNTEFYSKFSKIKFNKFAANMLKAAKLHQDTKYTNAINILKMINKKHNTFGLIDYYIRIIYSDLSNEEKIKKDNINKIDIIIKCTDDRMRFFYLGMKEFTNKEYLNAIILFLKVLEKGNDETAAYYLMMSVVYLSHRGD